MYGNLMKPVGDGEVEDATSSQSVLRPVAQSQKKRSRCPGLWPNLKKKRGPTLARPWIKPGTPGLEHRIGGLEKQDLTGNVSYDPANHQRMCELRRAKVQRVQQEIPPSEILGEASGDVLVIGWGSTYGAITSAVVQAQTEGKAVSALHLRFMNPLPPDLGEIIQRFDKVLVPELNLGQLVRILRAEFLVDARGLNKVMGLPLHVSEVHRAIDDLLYGEA